MRPSRRLPAEAGANPSERPRAVHGATHHPVGRRVAYETLGLQITGDLAPESQADVGELRGRCPESVRDGAQAKRFDVCAFCSEYPCYRIEGLAKRYVTLLIDGQRTTEIGLDCWIEEQEARKATRFYCADIYCHPCEVPDR